MESKQPQPVMEINLHSLDDILRKLPSEFQQVTKNLPELKKLAALAKLESYTIKARLYNEIKVTDLRGTENSIDAEIRVNPEYIEAHKHYLDIRENYDRAYTVKEQFLQKASALKGLISLFESRYWDINSNIDTATLKKE